jgi:cytochrome b
MVKVWDIFVRFSHWAVALGFFVAYLTEDDLLTLHVWAGYLVGVLVVLRLAWGIVGPKHARFGDFIVGPRRVLAYLMKLATFRAPRHLGHSPAGGAMAIVLWLGLVAIVWSGLEFYAVEEGRGPLAALSASPAVSVEGVGLVAAAVASEDEAQAGGTASEGGGGSVWEEIHEVLANLVMILVVLHLAGVLLACLVHRENLVRAMFDGRKREN